MEVELSIMISSRMGNITTPVLGKREKDRDWVILLIIEKIFMSNQTSILFPLFISF